MSSMFDINGDGKVDTGEQFVGYEIYKDVTNSFESPRPAKKIDGFTIFIIAIIVWQILKCIADVLY